MRMTRIRSIFGPLALVLGAGTTAQEYVGIGTPPPPVSRGEVTIKNIGPQDIILSLSASGCKMAEVRVLANESVKVSCGKAETLTTLLRTKMPNGEILERRQWLATGAHYFIASDNSGAFVLSTGTPAARPIQ